MGGGRAGVDGCMAAQTDMQVEVWSDVVCPWCWIGKRHLEQALSNFPHAEQVAVTWRAFELDPDAGPSTDRPYVRRLADKYGFGEAEGQAMVDRMVATGAGAGLDMRFDLARPGNTFDAHRLLHLAAERGVQDAVKEALFRAAFTDGEPVSDHDTLVRVVAAAGLDPAEARQVLAEDVYADEVRIEEKAAAELGATGVPLFVVDRRYGVAGAQPPEVLLQVLEQAWRERRPLTVVGAPAQGTAPADSCADGSCAV